MSVSKATQTKIVHVEVNDLLYIRRPEHQTVDFFRIEEVSLDESGSKKGWGLIHFGTAIGDIEMVRKP